jgi:pimeloyl-ACP methyl ester carboxylesterase
MVSTLSYTGASGLELRASQQGPQNGAPVLLLHGGGQTRNAWGSSLEALAARGFNAVSLDMRGHGDSEWSPDGTYALGAFADDLRQVIGTFDQPPALVGASLGGLASLLAVGEAPHATARSIVLVDVVPWMEPKGGEQVVGFMRNTSRGFDTLEAAADAVADYLPHRPRPERLDGLKRNMRKKSDGRWYWHWDPAFVAPQDGWDMDEVNRRLTEAVQAVPVPLLLVRGTNSEIVSEAGVQRFRELLPTGKVVEIAGAHHMVAGDDNDAFLDALMPFLEHEGGEAV